MFLKEKKIIVNSYISSSSYNLGTENSRCYITNEKTHCNFMFEGIVADLWNLIICVENTLDDEDKSQCLYALENFVKENELEDEIDDFLKELAQNDLIMYGTIDEIYNSILYEGIKFPIKSYSDEDRLFIEEKKQYISDNGFLYSIHIKYNFDIDKDKVFNIVDEALKIGVNKIILDARKCVIDEKFFEIARYIRRNRFILEIVLDCESIQNKMLINDVVNLYPSFVKIYIDNYSLEKDSLRDVIYGLKKRNAPIALFVSDEKIEKNIFEKFINSLSQENLHFFVMSNCLKNNQNLILNTINNFNLTGKFILIDDDMMHLNKELYISSDLDMYASSNFTDFICSLKGESIIKIWNDKILKK